MRNLMIALAAAIALASLSLAQGLGPVRLTPEDLAWSESSDGTALVAIAGENTVPGLYVYRVSFPGGFRNEAHFHPDDRVVTVMSGTLHMGYGEAFDEAVMRELPAGSVWTEPSGQAHFVWARNGEVVIQVVGVGPSGTTPAEQ